MQRCANLSVSIVCCNNEDVIGRTLESIKGLPAEIVAVDSGSTDNTLPMLEAAGCRIINQSWLGYVKQKQFALNACTRPWVLHLDSDESLEPDLVDSICNAVERDDPKHGGYYINRKIFYAGKLLQHAWQPEWRLRLVRKAHAQWSGYDPHDHLTITTDTLTTARIKGDMRHDAIPSIGSFLARQVKHSEIAAQSYLEMGKSPRVSKLITSPAGAYIKQVVRRGAWRDGWRGHVAAAATAAAALMKHAIFIELARSRETRGRRS